MGIIDDENILDDDKEIPRNSNRKASNFDTTPRKYKMNGDLQLGQILAIMGIVAIICIGAAYVTIKPCPDMTCAQANLTCSAAPDCVCNAGNSTCDPSIIIPDFAYYNHTNATWYVEAIPQNFTITIMNPANNSQNISQIVNRMTGNYYKAINMNVSEFNNTLVDVLIQ